jgi:hypothetical protein
MRQGLYGLLFDNETVNIGNELVPRFLRNDHLSFIHPQRQP